jgi:uncharacterized membrane protein
MKTYQYLDPEMIMGIVIALIILSVGVFAFYVTINAVSSTAGIVTPSATTTLQQNDTYYQWTTLRNSTEGTGSSVFNIVGIVLVIGAIMTIVGVVVSYTKR